MEDRHAWWQDLRHDGLFLDAQRLRDLIPHDPSALLGFRERKLRLAVTRLLEGDEEKSGEFVSFVLEHVCGFTNANGTWHRGTNVSSEWSRSGPAGETLKPNHLWTAPRGAVLPVFIDSAKRIGIGHGRRAVSNVLRWLRTGDERLALLTNGRQWRLIFAGLDFHASVEWDIGSWFLEGEISPALAGLRTLLTPALWTPAEEAATSPLAQAVLDSRSGQSDLSGILGERVRQAVEVLVRAHEQVLHDNSGDLGRDDIYRAAVRVVMRLVVTLFAEARELLPAENEVYHASYSLRGLYDTLERDRLRSSARLARHSSAWPRLLALFRLIHDGCSHEALPVTAYDGDLFRPGDPASIDGVSRATHLFESACFQHEVMSDRDVFEILNLLTRTRIRIRQGRSSTRVPAPVNFAELDNEYIGILYEGLLDYELRTAPADQPVIFLTVGDQPALPLATLEAMDDSALKSLLEKMKQRSSSSDDEEGESSEEDVTEDEDILEDADDEPEPEVDEDTATEDDEPDEGVRHTTRTRAEQWARRACEVVGIVRKPRGKANPEKQRQYDDDLGRAAKRLVERVILPNEYYLVRWGGTRKGSGTFYTRPQLAVPTVHRTLRPLAYDPPPGKDGSPDLDAPTEKWTPKKPETILALKVCDPACGSGSFPLAALRFLTNALYESLHHHNRIRPYAGEAVLDLIYDEKGEELLTDEKLPCPPDHDTFEPRTRAILRRYIVERCIYGVDHDPIAVELCRISLWIETLERELPMTFLNHKVRCGNSLVGAWFDQFLHYPVMAWDREGGDKSHTTAVHYKKDAWTKAIRERKKQVKQEIIEFIDGATLYFPVDLTTVRTGHDTAEAALMEIHDLGITRVAERAARFRDLQSDPEFLRLKDAFDLWCALWFWPPEKIDLAPLPHDFAADDVSEEARAVARRVSAKHRFFHWELEFPDVFNARSHGFDAVLGNPPWETLQPQSKEFFSAHDPLYRSYGKQDALVQQREYFNRDQSVEVEWLEYNAFFKGMSNWLKHTGVAFGDRVTTNNRGRGSHDFNLGDRGRNSFDSSKARHARWKQKREETTGYSADTDHAFRYQGEGKAYTYKMFCEQGHAILRDGGRLGLILPSGLYSDHGSSALRTLFIEKCRWEWLFGFENREGIFDIHRSFKFNPVIIAKGGTTEAIRTAFMRRKLADWERGERFATEYPRDRIIKFSPKSKALLEIQSQRDLEVLTKIYSNSVLLGDQSENGWGIQYAQGDFNMTSDSKLFPPRPKWEEWGYRPDEYSRWIKGPWQPIEQLWDELGVDPSQPVPIDADCASRIDDGIARGEVAKTDVRGRIAQPPYDRLPIPRAAIPPGVILSREADAFIREQDIPEVTFTDAAGKPLKIKVENARGKKEEIEVKGPAIALPVYVGKMVGMFDACEQAWLEGAGRSSRWKKLPWYDKQLRPDYLMAAATFAFSPSFGECRLGFVRISTAVHFRTFIAALLPNMPAVNTVPVLWNLANRVRSALSLITAMQSFCNDFVVRRAMGYLDLTKSVIEELPLPPLSSFGPCILGVASRLSFGLHVFAEYRLDAVARGYLRRDETAAFAEHERLRVRVMHDAISALIYGLNINQMQHVYEDCALPLNDRARFARAANANPKGFWRVDKDKHPEQRHTVLSLVAFHDLQKKIEACGGDIARGIEQFCNQNDGEGWMLPEALRLADYGLGHDERAKQHQPVRECFGPRFYDWQLAQTPEESWTECHLHARNLLGEAGYRQLLAEIEAERNGDAEPGAQSCGRPAAADTTASAKGLTDGRKSSKRTAGDDALFDTEDAPLFQRDE